MLLEAWLTPLRLLGAGLTVIWWEFQGRNLKFKISLSMVYQFNNEYCLHSFCLMDFKLSSGMLSSSNNDIQKKKIQNLIHSLSSMGPIVSMEIPLAMAYLKVSHIMGRVWQVNSFENQLYSTRLIW